MSEASERGSLDDGVLEDVLRAVGDPALVCDRAGAVRAWNDAFAERTAADATVAGTSVGTFVDWLEPDGDPLDRALDGADVTTATARLAGDGRRYSATARPLTRDGSRDGDGVVGAVVSFSGAGDDDWAGYEAAVDASPDVLFVVDDEFRVRLVSDAFADLTKIPTAEFTGKPTASLVEYGVIDEETLDRAHEALAAVFDGERETASFVSEPRILEEGVVEVKVSSVRRDGEVVGAVAAVRDVTARERSAAARRSSRDRLQTILETLPVAMVVVDGDGRIDHVQGLDFDRMPCDRTDLLGARVDAFAGEYGDVVEGCRRALDGQGGSATTTIAGRTYEAVFEPVREDGAVTGTIAVAVDVTDRERRERELAATNERLDLALHNTDAGVYVWHVEEDRIEFHGRTGPRVEDVGDRYRLGDALRDYVHPQDRDRVREAFRTAVEGGGDLAVEFRVDRSDGDPRWTVAEGEVHTRDGEPARLVGTLRDITDRKEREKELVEREQRLRAVLESSADPIAMQDPDGRYRVVNEAMVEVAGRSREAVRGARPADVFDAETAARLERHRRDVLATESARVVEDRVPAGDGEGERVVQLTVAPHYGPDQRVRGTVSIARDITELERRRNELETLTEIQGLIHESISALTAATTREAIKETVCERLAESPFYEAAWIGTHDASDRKITADYESDRAATYLEAARPMIEPDIQSGLPVVAAYRTGEVQVLSDLGADLTFEPLADLAAEQGFRSAVYVPLTHGATTHGVLAVYTGRADAFTERDVAAFEVLGEAVGFALSAARNRRLLESDRVLELEFAVQDCREPFDRLSAAGDGRFVFDNAVHTSDGRVVDYVTVENCDLDVLADALAEQDDLDAMRRLDGDRGPHFELKWHESVHQHLETVGARGRRCVVEDGTGRLVVEAPRDADVRRVTDAIAAQFDGVELQAKRERERADVRWWQPHSDVGARLTDRQRSILLAAYYSGYYEWPRETDAETLADSLDIASTTLLQHLRKGHNRVLEAMFDS